MKNIFKLVFIIMVFLSAQNTFAEEIKNYHIDIELHKDSHMTVTENIDYDFGNLQRHGIFRFIPLYFNVEGQKKMYGLQERELKFKNLSVERDGTPESYTKKVKDKNGNYVIKIGRANKTITGIHNYKIKYDVLGSLRYFKDYDELYWNAIGLDWKVPIKNSEVNVHSENIEFKDFSCYAGPLGSQKGCSIAERKSKNFIQFLQKNLNSHQGMSIAVSFDKDLVPQKEFFGFTTKAFVLAAAGTILTIGFSIIYFIRKYQRKYFIYDPIHPRYTPPENLDAVFMGYIFDKEFKPRDISAGIIQLAHDGYIEIEKIKNTSFFGRSKDYIFRLKDDQDIDGLGQKEKIILKMLSLNTSVFEGTKKLESKMSEISRVGLYKLTLNLSLYMETVAKELLLIKGKKKSFAFLPFILFFATFGSFISGNGYLGAFMFVMTFISIISVSFFNFEIKQRYTEKGWKIKHAIEGFKLFLEMTERDRYEFFNNPANNPQEFMEYLPYAIALGVEKKWAKQFESISIPQPEWYKGSGPFVASRFANEMSSFSKSVTSSFATKASSGSGSHGGGFSGGGSGGGGGGSW